MRSRGAFSIRFAQGKITTAPILPYQTTRDLFGSKQTARILQPELYCLNNHQKKWHPVAFLSKSLSPVERNYEIHDKEMLAIVRA